jgi:hypothetical protein
MENGEWKMENGEWGGMSGRKWEIQAYTKPRAVSRGIMVGFPLSLSWFRVNLVALVVIFDGGRSEENGEWKMENGELGWDVGPKVRNPGVHEITRRVEEAHGRVRSISFGACVNLVALVVVFNQAAGETILRR